MRDNWKSLFEQDKQKVYTGGDRNLLGRIELSIDAYNGFYYSYWKNPDYMTFSEAWNNTKEIGATQFFASMIYEWQFKLMVGNIQESSGGPYSGSDMSSTAYYRSYWIASCEDNQRKCMTGRRPDNNAIVSESTSSKYYPLQVIYIKPLSEQQ